MDDAALEEVTKQINPQRGIQSEVNRVLKRNESLQKSDTWNEASDKQIRQVRDRITVGDSHDSYKYRKNDKTFIEVDSGNYKRVTDKEDVLVNDRTGQVFIRNADGETVSQVDKEELE